jgi:hypothetical protein
MADANIAELRPGRVNDPTNALRQRRHRKRKAQSSVTAHASRAQTACRETQRFQIGRNGLRSSLPVSPSSMLQACTRNSWPPMWASAA